MKSIETYQQLNYPKWKRINYQYQGDEIKESLSPFLPEFEGKELFEKAGGEIRFKEKNEFLQPIKGIDMKFSYEAESLSNSYLYIKVKKGLAIDTPLLIRYDMNRQNTLVENLVIEMEERASAKIVFVYEGGKKAYHNGVLKMHLSKEAELSVFKLQLLDEEADYFDAAESYLEQGAKIHYNTYDFGSDVVVSDYSANIDGIASESIARNVYLRKGKQKSDISYNSYLRGAHSHCDIEVKGALLDRATKVFRGNLKFDRGSKASFGKESESVLLLSDQVASHAIPALLCDEDDVIGEHAASAGQVNEQQLFYLMSRGFQEKEAKRMIVHGTFSKIIDEIPVEDLRVTLEERLERILYE